MDLAFIEDLFGSIMTTMNIQASAIKTADDFLRWNEGREGKREFVRGRIVEMMVNVSRNHAKLASAVIVALAAKLDLAAFDIGSADFAVKTPAGIRYPDVFVDRAGGSGSDLAARAPVLLAEILSPSSLAVDFGEKAEEYTAIPSLSHYLVLAQDEPRVWLWSRDEEGAFAKPEMIVGREETLPLTGLGVTLALADLYRGIA
ncbi:Uma2 family endonuclease [Aurantimonas sp. E1-2-R+4]|uniref:Uma2 family endonuclease n=1 Tax=Aurantimonas sp. E1-2-R+4 TaxID=3113714 RepID=UPI002F949691